MERDRVEDMDEWRMWKRRIIEGGFHLWQTQYGWDLPEGLIVSFIGPYNERFEIWTHNKDIAEDIESSGL